MSDNNDFDKIPAAETPLSQIHKDFEVELPEDESPFSAVQFGERLLERRTQLEMGQKRLADALNVSVPAYSKIESGKTGINREYAKKLAPLLQCTPHYLLGYTDILYGVTTEKAGKQRQENIIPVLLGDEDDIKDIRDLEAKLHKDTELFRLLIKALDAPDKKRRTIRRIVSILLE